MNRHIVELLKYEGREQINFSGEIRACINKKELSLFLIG